MTYQFGVGEYETSDGRKAEVLAERKGILIGIVYDDSHIDGLNVMRWKKDGSHHTGHKNSQLVPPKQTRTYWVNIYDSFRTLTYLHADKRAANAAASEGCIACKEITIQLTPGEGLE